MLEHHLLAIFRLSKLVKKRWVRVHIETALTKRLKVILIPLPLRPGKMILKLGLSGKVCQLSMIRYLTALQIILKLNSLIIIKQWNCQKGGGSAPESMKK